MLRSYNPETEMFIRKVAERTVAHKKSGLTQQGIHASGQNIDLPSTLRMHTERIAVALFKGTAATLNAFNSALIAWYGPVPNGAIY